MRQPRLFQGLEGPASGVPQNDSTAAKAGATIQETRHSCGMKMKPALKAPALIEAYIDGCPQDVQVILREICALIRRTAPMASETISYGMPTFSMGRVLAHVAAFKGHIGLFPPVRDPQLHNKTARYRGEKGNLRFPLDEPIPYDLIGEIVAARVRALSDQSSAEHATSPTSGLCKAISAATLASEEPAVRPDCG